VLAAAPEPALGAARLALTRLSLTDFRCYQQLGLRLDAGLVVLHGPNGAGKTNLLEALSFLSPGRGLRRARLAEVTRHGAGGGWSVAARLETPSGVLEAGTGLSGEGERRMVRIDGKNATGPAALAERLGVQWLTPQMDRLFLEGPSPRRRFLDRLVFGFDPGHARRVANYERLLRERARLLRDGPADPAWLNALETEMAGEGVAVAAARRQALARLEAALARADEGFPRPALALSGTVEGWLETLPAVDAELRFAEALRRNRGRDGELGGAGEGPHRSDLEVRHAATGIAAAQCSTGEQKALLIAIVLASARIEATERRAAPILLLDEVAAHLDAERRQALYDAVAALDGQAWLTGTDAGLFDPLRGQACFLAVRRARVTVEE
jgi:DNA replication and repair protein RecF